MQKGSAAAKTGKILPHDWVRPRVPACPRVPVSACPRVSACSQCSRGLVSYALVACSTTRLRLTSHLQDVRIVGPTCRILVNNQILIPKSPVSSSYPSYPSSPSFSPPPSSPSSPSSSSPSPPLLPPLLPPSLVFQVIGVNGKNVSHADKASVIGACRTALESGKPVTLRFRREESLPQSMEEERSAMVRTSFYIIFSVAKYLH